jgi:preprotein translocase subunit SecF
VVYDRIREKRHRFATLNNTTAVNVAISETMARSINNSLTIIFMLLALILFGGDTVKWFVVALLVGTVAGTYSSPFVAGPLLIFWDSIFKSAKFKR